jgi:hypothetical protein
VGALGAGALNEKGLGLGAAAEGLRPPLLLLLLPKSLMPLLGFCGAASAASFSRMPLLTLGPASAPLVPSKDSSREVEPVRAADSALISWGVFGGKGVGVERGGGGVGLRMCVGSGECVGGGLVACRCSH